MGGIGLLDVCTWTDCGSHLPLWTFIRGSLKPVLLPEVHKLGKYKTLFLVKNWIYIVPMSRIHIIYEAFTLIAFENSHNRFRNVTWRVVELLLLLLFFWLTGLDFEVLLCLKQFEDNYNTRLRLKHYLLSNCSFWEMRHCHENTFYTLLFYYFLKNDSTSVRETFFHLETVV